MSAVPRIVIIGAGHAGGTAAALLRQYGHQGEIVLFGEEMIGPYQRPPLSKAYLKGHVDAESLKLRADEFYRSQGITLRLGARVSTLDRAHKAVVLEDGERSPYDVLILATGSRLRKLPLAGSANLQGLHELHNVADAEGLKAVLEHGKRLAVIGGGYIGLEVAASARSLGAHVVVIEREARVLARVASEPISAFFQQLHAAHGVEVLTGGQVERLEAGEDGYIDAVHVRAGTRIACDAALVGIGALSCDELAREAGLACENGVTVDVTARTSDPDIYAIGDATWRPMPFSGGRMFRLESVQNALEQARQAACAIMGRPAPGPEVPWFWSDQYDVKLQIAGISLDVDDLLIRGTAEQSKFAVFHMKGDRLIAVEAVNSPAEFVAGRQLIASGKPVPRQRLLDSRIGMKEVSA